MGNERTCICSSHAGGPKVGLCSLTLRAAQDVILPHLSLFCRSQFGATDGSLPFWHWFLAWLLSTSAGARKSSNAASRTNLEVHTLLQLLLRRFQLCKMYVIQKLYLLHSFLASFLVAVFYCSIIPETWQFVTLCLVQPIMNLQQLCGGQLQVAGEIPLVLVMYFGCYFIFTEQNCSGQLHYI